MSFPFEIFEWLIIICRWNLVQIFFMSRGGILKILLNIFQSGQKYTQRIFILNTSWAFLWCLTRKTIRTENTSIYRPQYLLLNIWSTNRTYLKCDTASVWSVNVLISWWSWNLLLEQWAVETSRASRRTAALRAFWTPTVTKMLVCIVVVWRAAHPLADGGLVGPCTHTHICKHTYTLQWTDLENTCTHSFWCFSSQTLPHAHTQIDTFTFSQCNSHTHKHTLKLLLRLCNKYKHQRTHFLCQNLSNKHTQTHSHIHDLSSPLSTDTHTHWAPWGRCPASTLRPRFSRPSRLWGVFGFVFGGSGCQPGVQRLGRPHHAD